MSVNSKNPLFTQPADCLQTVLSFLPPADMARAARTCKEFQQPVSNNPTYQQHEAQWIANWAADRRLSAESADLTAKVFEKVLAWPDYIRREDVPLLGGPHRYAFFQVNLPTQKHAKRVNEMLVAFTEELQPESSECGLIKTININCLRLKFDVWISEKTPKVDGTVDSAQDPNLQTYLPPIIENCRYVESEMRKQVRQATPPDAPVAAAAAAAQPK
jgi:hypothetical protein